MKQVQQIDNILAGMNSVSSETKKLPTSLKNSSAIALREKYGTAENFLVRCNPSFQSYYTDKPLIAFRHETPSLGLLATTYGKDAPISWLVPEIKSISEFCGCKEKFSKEQLRETSTLISTAYPWLKVSELLLFFGWLKLGRYGKFYGCLDPMVITTALQDFIRERSIYIDRLDQQKREKEAEEDRKKPRYTRAEWEEMKSKRE